VEELEEGTPDAVMAQTGMEKKKILCASHYGLPIGVKK
jgi:hypothetical protein